MQYQPDTTTGKSPRPRQNAPENDSPGSLTGGRSASAGASASFGAGASTAEILTPAKEKLADTASHAGDKVASRLDMQKDRAAEGLGSVAQALRQASNQLGNQSEGATVHEYIASAANQVERLSGYLRSTDTKQMVKGVERFARQQPALFMGGAFMLGLLGARFLKSSSEGNSSPGSVQRAESPTQVETRPTYSEQRGYSGAGRPLETGENNHRSAGRFTQRGGEDF